MRTVVGELLSLARWQLLARTVILFAPLAMLAAAEPLAEGDLPTVLVVLIVGLGASTAVFPDSHTGSVTLAVLVGVWLIRIDRTTSPWVLGAAVSIAAFHIATALAAFAPPGATLDTAVRDRWARRSALVLGVVLASWALVAGINHADTGPNGALYIAGLTIVGAGAWALRRSGRPT